ncbi:hypothetical protein DFH09DRAFT_1111484 [Mycena vulgaris]|nr:hypothetical protein DFH09DRAFT_1111484 [Mycena vulgaris]
MQPCLVAQSDKILRSWVDLESTESADLEWLPKGGGTGVEVATATSEFKRLFSATRGNSEEEDETKLKEDSYIRLERKERANAALIRNMAAPAAETQRPGEVVAPKHVPRKRIDMGELSSSTSPAGSPPLTTPLEFSSALLHSQTLVLSKKSYLSHRQPLRNVAAHPNPHGNTQIKFLK